MNKLLFFATFFVVFSVLALPGAYAAEDYLCKDCITTCAYQSFTQEQFEDCFSDQCKSMGQDCSHVTLDEALNYVERVKGCISTCLNERPKTEGDTTEADIKACQKECNQRTSLF